MAVKKKIADDFELHFLEGVLAKAPDFLQALMALGDLYTKKGMYQKGLEVDKKLAALHPDNPFILYNLACSYSLLNELDKAFVYLQEAIHCGYDNFYYMFTDGDLSNLHKDSRFQQYISRISTKQNPSN